MKRKIFTLLTCLILLALCLASCGSVEFKVNFIVDGENYAIINTNGGETIKMPDNPTKEGYTFDGWYWDKDTWQKPFTANSLLDAPLSSDMSVYAKWNCDHLSVSDWIVDIEATCKAEGSKHKECTVCVATLETEAIDKPTTHTTSDWIVDTESTCKAEGSKHKECTVCGVTTESEAIARTSVHSAVTDNYVAPTETTTGLTEGSHCSVCGLVIKAQEVIPSLSSGNCSITSEAMTLSGTHLSAKVSNTTTNFSFLNDISVLYGASYVVARDIDCINVIPSKTTLLNIGDNTFYILVTNADKMQLYSVTIRRLPLYKVSFETYGGTSIASQTVEEGSLATKPADPTRAGYTFTDWDFDYSTPITANKTVYAQWNVHTDTPYKVEYYLQNLTKTGYDLKETENLTGTTDTTATAEIKNFEHFTHKSTVSGTKLSGNIAGDGSLVLKVYYTRDSYTVNASPSGVGTITGGGTYPYGMTVTLTASAPNIGYDFLGWYDGETLITADKEYSCQVSTNMNITAKYEVKAEMTNFNFTSTFITCKITGIKDNTVTSIVVPDYVTEISRDAFSGCSSLESITLPFVGGSKSATSASSSTLFGYIFGTSSYTGGTATKQYYTDSSYTTYYIPTTLKSVTITGGNILYGAFYNCDSLTGVTIGNDVTSIGSFAFYYCDSLTSVTIGNGVTSIGDYSFYNCDSLTCVTIPDSVIIIGKSAFPGCDSLTIYCEAASEPSSWNSNWNYSSSYSDCPVVWNCNNNEIADDGYIYTIIDGIRYALKDSIATVTRQPRNITVANIPSKVTYKSIEYSVTSIGSSAFDQCFSLTSITIPDSVIIIGSYAFLGCGRLTIYCEAASKPSGWYSDWNDFGRPVVWGYTESGE